MRHGSKTSGLAAALALAMALGLALPLTAAAPAAAASLPPASVPAASVPAASVPQASAGSHAARSREATVGIGPAPVPVSVVETTAGLNPALGGMPHVFFDPGQSPELLPTISIDPRISFQHISGFGAAVTDTAAWLIHDELPAASATTLMQDLFSTTSGIGLRFLRVPVGASDFTATGEPYTYDDVPAGQSDPGLSGFTIEHDLPYIIPTLQQALAIDPRIQLLATPWTPPPWMKANDAYGNNGLAGSLEAADYDAYAQYIVKFLQSYSAQGVPINALTVQNEPASTTFPGLEFGPQEEASFISSSLVPALKAAGLGSVKIFGVDSGYGDLGYAKSLLQGPAGSDLAGISWHCYGGMQQIAELQAEHRGLNQIVSECSPGIIPWAPAEAAIDALRNDVTSFALWNLALDPQGGPVQPGNPSCGGCTAPATINEATGEMSLGLDYYQLGQLSRYIQPGAVRIASTRLVEDYTIGRRYGVTPGLDDVAVRNPDGSYVLVTYNDGPSVTFRIAWNKRSTIFTLPSGATATFSWR